MTFVLSDTGRYVTDGGLETDLIYHRGLDLPAFASFPLVEDETGRGHLTDYYDGYAAIARRAGAGLLLEAPTWRANPDWGATLGYDAAALDRVNRAAIALLHRIGQRLTGIDDIVVSGVIGPRGDGYVADQRPEVAGAARYHRPQIEAFAAAGADLAHAMTMTTTAEAAGIVRAANEVGLPVAISFTVETDGRLPDATPLGVAIAEVATAGPVAYFGVNCAHPDHIAGGLDDDSATRSIAALRPNASRRTHAELDVAEDLDEGDIPDLRVALDALRQHLPAVRIVGGCCGTDARHVAALWDR
ncbi:homocysteine S-methyltransferase family protein [Plantactinospora sp. KBS50]|uniref:homocysteine S-methyltransferase family protein n=1 Tax=Plantactinospora sp. KBS50 TaxID=2024580 RepID=UPI000BAAA7FB|nr:homocysteine S-methyltransferase family protein [Plantactinospora sp. KBS50]ASW53357.1 homocysteine S-methyltransferase [Plantactinospora sp. KBS50]